METEELDPFKYLLHCREAGVWFDDYLSLWVQVRGGLMGEW